MCPARSTIYGNVLVSAPGKIISIIDISPVPLFGKSSRVYFLNSHFKWSFFSEFELVLCYSLAWLIVWQKFWVLRCLRVRTIFGIVFVPWIFLFCVCGLVHFRLCPCILRNSPRTITFDVNVVFASHYFDKPWISKSSSPRIPNEPIFDSVFYSITNHRNLMSNLHFTSSIFENTTCITMKFGCSRNTTSNRSSLVDFLHHIFFSFDSAVLIYSINIVRVRNEAISMRVTISADVDRSALHAIVMSSRSVDRASLISDHVFMYVFEGAHWFTSIASFIICWTRDKNLWREVDVWPRSFTRDLNSIRESWGCRMCPTWATILRYVLVS